MTIKGLFSYNQASEGAKALAAALGVPRIKHRGSTFVGSRAKTIINWGGSTVPEAVAACNLLNTPERVTVAIDKLASFTAFRAAGVPHPEFTTELSQAQRWLEGGDAVFARTMLRASSGRGIEIMMPDHRETWNVRAPLYSKYTKKRDEYRVHVVRGQVIDVQRKGLREEFQGREGVNHMVRNLANGFVFVRNDGREVPAVVTEAGVAAVNSLGLDFGAVDVVYNHNARRAYVIEVNCAPGLVGTTIENYSRALGAL